MTDSPLDVRLLGDVQVTRGTRTITVGGAQRLALLALLSLGAPHSVGRAEIIDALWGEHPPSTAVNAVQGMVSALRKALGAAAVRNAGSGYRLAADVSVDVADFARLTSRGSGELARGQAAAAAETLRAALGLWRGPALGGLESVPFAAVERERLEELRLGALQQRIEADLQVARHAEVVTELESLVSAHPLREGLRGLLMQALYRCGRQAEALAVYDVGRRVLRDELGIDPSPALRSLHQRLLSQQEANPQAPAAASVRTRLPALLDDTVGRSDELAALEAMLADGRGRMVSVVGTGGVGKTRLAVALGAQLAATTNTKVVFAPLGHAEKPADVPATICQALGLRTGDDGPGTVEAALVEGRTLLICDNFEHVLSAAALLPGWLAAAPGLRILVTSRQPLAIRGERLFHLEPLGLLAGRGVEDPSPAAQLFVARARDSDPTFAPSVAELMHVEEIARKCDGLPLALELAAARTRALPLAELNRRLADPLSLLTTGSRDVPERQRTLRSSIAWSMGALSAGQMRFLAQLTVFRGGFTLEAAAGVSGFDADEALALIEALLDRCLIHRRAIGGQHRFAMLETISEYAVETLGDDLVDVPYRHARYFRDWMRPLPEPTRTGVNAAVWEAHLAERANLRTAVRWALDSPDGELAADLVIVAAAVWDQSGPQVELEGWLERLLQRADISPGRRADAYWWQATLYSSSDPRRMVAPLQAARALAEEHHEIRRLVWIEIVAVLGEILRERPDDAVWAVRDGQALAVAHPGTTNLHVSILLINSQLAAEGGSTDAVALRERHEEVARTSARSTDLRSVILMHLSELMLRRDDAQRALIFAEAGVDLAGQTAAAGGLADSLAQRGWARLALGHRAEALDDLRAAMSGHLNLRAAALARRDLARLAVAGAVDHPDATAFAWGVVTTVSEEPLAWPDGAPPEGPAVARGVAMVADLGARAALAAALNGFYAG